MVIKTELITWLIESQCPVNGCNGSMVSTGATITKGTEKTRYRHNCNTCDYHDNFEYVFPRVEYEIEGSRNYYPKMNHALHILNNK